MNKQDIICLNNSDALKLYVEIDHNHKTHIATISNISLETMIIIKNGNKYSYESNGHLIELYADYNVLIRA